MIFSNSPDRLVLRQVVSDRNPGATSVCALQEIRLEVCCVLAILKRGVDGVCVMIGSNDATHIRQFGNTWKSFDLTPALAAVLRYLNQTIVGADVDQAIL